MHKGERKLHQWVRDKVLQPRDRLDRVENVACPGMFDASGCFEGREFWVEYKAPDIPYGRRKTTPLLSGNHQFLQTQRNWALSVKHAGGRCFVLIGSTAHRMLVPSHKFHMLNTATLEELLAASIWHMEIGHPLAREYYVTLRTTLRDY